MLLIGIIRQSILYAFERILAEEILRILKKCRHIKSFLSDFLLFNEFI